MNYQPSIGLEIHAHLKTRTKMFCSCPNNFDENHPNINVCPICLGHPGTLPTINQEAVLMIIKLGLALEGKIADYSHFDRKSYFYPDLPKGYQISQYERPLVQGGSLANVRIRRIHLEEDAGRLLHSDDNKNEKKEADYGYRPNSFYSLVDFNRAGAPLMELVTEPDIKDAEGAVRFAKELQLVLRYLDISDADMEKGQMRVEANISLAEKKDLNQKLGVKVEIKNLNSFKSLGDAIQYELKRQERILRENGEIIQETRGWNEKKGITESQRAKESAHDYRYFPEPDLPPLDLTPGVLSWDINDLKNHLPELPEAKRLRFGKEYAINDSQIEVLISDRLMAKYFEEAASELKARTSEADYQLLINYLATDLRGLMKEAAVNFDELKINPEEFAHLIFLIQAGSLSSRLAKDILRQMFETGEDPEVILKEAGLKIIEAKEELEAVVEEVLKSHHRAVSDYKKGKGQALQFLLGQVMAKTKGQASPQKVNEILIKKLAQF